jgi:hypothetical protein
MKNGKVVVSIGPRVKLLDRTVEARGIRGYVPELRSRSEALPNDFQCELNLASRGLRGIEPAEAGRRGSSGEERHEVVDRRREVSVIQHVKELGPELDMEGFRDSSDAVVLNHGEINVEQPRPNDCVAPQVAEEVETGEG